MDYNNIEKIVCFNFRDYDNKEKIKQLIKKVYKKTLESFSDSSYMLNDIAISMSINSKIYYELLHSDDEEDQKYMFNLCKKTMNYIINVRDKYEKDYEYLKTDEEVYSYLMELYTGDESITPFISHFSLGYYNGFDEEEKQKEKEEIIKKEKENLESLKKMYSFEKKLRIDF